MYVSLSIETLAIQDRFDIERQEKVGGNTPTRLSGAHWTTVSPDSLAPTTHKGQVVALAAPRRPVSAARLSSASWRGQRARGRSRTGSRGASSTRA
eukprot:scaffold23268_cov67-Phaeocystis_antarctica.AAC.3